MVGLSTCHQRPKQPHLPVAEQIFSAAIQPVDYRLQRFVIDNKGQAYGVKGNKLYSINTETDELNLLYTFDAAILGFHITVNNSFIISTDNNHWSEKAPCHIYESIDKGSSFKQIKTIDGGCALWLSISSDNTGSLYIGEYGPKKPGVSKNVWKRDSATGEWMIIFQAPLDSDAHIHRVAVNPYNQNLWITTGDTRKNRGGFISTDGGTNWQKKLDSQATAVAFTKNKIYWGEDEPDYGGVLTTDYNGDHLAEVFNANNHGNYAGSVYEMLVLSDQSILAPIMKYPDQTSVASLWHGKEQKWKLLMLFESLPGRGKDVSSIAGPDKNGFVLLTGYKINVNRLQPLD